MIARSSTDLPVPEDQGVSVRSKSCSQQNIQLTSRPSEEDILPLFYGHSEHLLLLRTERHLIPDIFARS